MFCGGGVQIRCDTGSPYFVDVEIIQIERTELYCAMFSSEFVEGTSTNSGFLRSLRCC